MRPIHWLALTGVALAGIVVAALRWVPAASLGELLAAVAFVIVLPWPVVCFVTGVRPLVSAGRALRGRPENATRGDATTLRLLGDVAPAAGALGAVASFHAAMAAVAAEKGVATFDSLDRILVASAVPLALGFALKWCTFDPIARAILRAHDEPDEGITGLTAWRIVAIVCATALLVEAVGGVAFAPAAAPKYDTSLVVTNTGFASTDPAPIRIAIDGDGFAVDGKRLHAVPGAHDELARACVERWRPAFKRPVEITVADDADVGDLVGAIASCVAAHHGEAWRTDAPPRPPIRVVVADWPRATSVRLVHGAPMRIHIVQLQLAKSDVSEARELERHDENAIHLTWDSDQRVCEIIWSRQVCDLDELQAIVAKRRMKTRLVRPDHEAPCRRLLDVLRVLTHARIDEAWIEVRGPVPE